jgi:site-specific DNA recombinase
MKSAYLYVRVSTDEQKRKGYSLPEQEDRLLKYCEYNDIAVMGVYREDFSAKNFNRPEWKKLVSEVRKTPSKEEKNILFIKWDRFSRNIQYAYEMIGLLRKYNTKAMAIDQPVDLDIPESSVMLAVYLSVPEAENMRRALNTASGIRRAKLMGRYPNKSPVGYINLTAIDGKKFIAPKQPEAGIIRWVFLQLGKNIHKMEDVRKMAQSKGLRCSRSYFSKLVRNPAYCGLISVTINPQEQQMVKGVHEPLISETLFYEVQEIINTKRKITSRTDELKAMFFLTGHLICPFCGRKLCGSFSQGSTKKHPYYHCRGRCKTRINASKLNNNYQSKLQQLVLAKGVRELFYCILEDWNTGTHRAECLQERKLVLKQLEERRNMLSKARELFIADVLKFDDFSEMKKECQTKSTCLKKELKDIAVKLREINKQHQSGDRSFVNIFQGYADIDVVDKKHIAKLIPPVSPDFKTGNLSLGLNSAFSKILMIKL